MEKSKKNKIINLVVQLMFLIIPIMLLAAGIFCISLGIEDPKLSEIIIIGIAFLLIIAIYSICYITPLTFAARISYFSNKMQWVILGWLISMAIFVVFLFPYEIIFQMQPPAIFDAILSYKDGHIYMLFTVFYLAIFVLDAATGIPLWIIVSSTHKDKKNKNIKRMELNIDNDKTSRYASEVVTYGSVVGYDPIYFASSPKLFKTYLKFGIKTEIETLYFLQESDKNIKPLKLITAVLKYTLIIIPIIIVTIICIYGVMNPRTSFDVYLGNENYQIPIIEGYKERGNSFGGMSFINDKYVIKYENSRMAVSGADSNRRYNNWLKVKSENKEVKYMIINGKRATICTGEEDTYILQDVGHKNYLEIHINSSDEELIKQVVENNK